MNNPERLAVMKRRHFVPSLSAIEWSRVGDFVIANRNQLEAAQDLAHAHRMILSEHLGSKMNKAQWLSSVLMMMSIHSVRCAGFPVIAGENHTVEINLKPAKLRKARAS